MNFNRCEMCRARGPIETLRYEYPVNNAGYIYFCRSPRCIEIAFKEVAMREEYLTLDYVTARLQGRWWPFYSQPE